MGIGVGSGSVGTAGPLVGGLRLKTGEGDVAFPGKDELAELGAGTEDELGESENDDVVAGKDGEDDELKGVAGGNRGTEDGGKDDERGSGDDGKEEAAKVCPAASRTRKTECRMDSQYRHTSQEEMGEGGVFNLNVHNLYTQIARRAVRGARRQRQSVHEGTTSKYYGSAEYGIVREATAYAL